MSSYLERLEAAQFSVTLPADQMMLMLTGFGIGKAMECGEVHMAVELGDQFERLRLRMGNARFMAACKTLSTLNDAIEKEIRP